MTSIDANEIPQPDVIEAGSAGSEALDWAVSVMSGSTNPELRGRVLNTYSGLTSILIDYDVFKWKTVQDWVKSKGLDRIAPQLLVLVSAIPHELSPDQFELIGFTSFVMHSINDTASSHNHNIDLNFSELAARRNNLRDFGDEDWLTSMAFLVKRDGRKKEQEVKTKAAEENLDYLSRVSSRRITLEDIEFMYQRVTNAVYPQSRQVMVFRDYALAEDRGVELAIKGNPLLSHYLMSDKRNAIKYYLREYNAILDFPSSAEYDMSMIYATYLTIHPHADGNGTMARTLVDHYCDRRGIARVDWSKMSNHSRALGAYMFGNTEPMELWFSSAPRKQVSVTKPVE